MNEGLLGPRKGVNDVRTKIFRGLGLIGTVGPATCWLIALMGVSHDTFPGDIVAVALVIPAIWSPIVAFWTNEGEVRTLKDKLLDFGVYWFFINTACQTLWELPWFLLKFQIFDAHPTSEVKWTWIWWAYGVADTRYIKENEMVVAVTGLDGAISLAEVAVCLLYYKGYRVLFTMLVIFLEVAQGWGQALWYMSEVSLNFRNISTEGESSYLGAILKYGVLNIPWIIFPFFSLVGLFWNLAIIYKKRGVQEYLAKINGNNGAVDGQQLVVSEGVSFSDEAEVFIRLDDENGVQILETDTDRRPVKKMLWFMIIYPLVFITVNTAIYNHLKGW